MSAPTSPSASPTHGGATSSRLDLQRQLGLWSAVAIVVGTTIGSGIFRTPAGVTDRLPGPLPVFSIWLVGGLLAMSGALAMAEIAGAYPNTGGIFHFILKAWGRLPAFVFGWAQLSLIRAASLGAIAVTFAEYFLRVLGYDPGIAPYDGWANIVAAGAIILTGAFNYVGVRSGAIVQNLTTAAKFAGLLFIVILALVLGLPRYGVANFTPAVPEGSFALGAFGLALVSVLWAYDGWADLTFVSGEIRDPRRNLPRALIFGTGAVMVIYLLANFAYMVVLPVGEIRTSPLVAADVASRLMGGIGVAFVGLTVMISTFGTLNGTLLTSPRIFYAMADEGLFFDQFRKVHPRYGTPYIAIALVAALGVIFVLAGDFEALADAFVTASLPFYALGVGAIFVLRRRADYDPPFRAPLYPLTPVLFVLAVIYLLANAVIDPGSRFLTLIVFGVILLGIPVYYLTVGRRGAPPIRRS